LRCGRPRRFAGRRRLPADGAVSEASFYVWKKKYGQLGLTEIRELRQLRDENARLKRLVADLTLDKHILGKSSEKSFEARPAPCAGGLDERALSGEHGAGLSAGAILSGEVLSQEHRYGPVGLAPAHPRDRPRQTAVRLPTHPRDAATGGLAGEQEARSTSLPAGRAAAAYPHSPTQAHVPSPWSGARAERSA